MFFGTPHRGSGLASWANIIGNILRATSFGTSTNVQLAKDLQPKSRLLDFISTSFLDRCGKLKIISCYETSKMDFLNCIVVDKDSATLGIPTETVIALDGDHRSICRFSNIDAKQFGPVKTRLDSLIQSLRLTDSRRLRDEFLSSLHTSDYVAHKNRNPLPVNGTCTWIFNHPVYEAWIESPCTSLLWISADPGCGKSVLASFLADHFSDSQVAGINICYFFFKSDNIEQSDAVNCVTALLYQLYSQQKDLITTGVNRLQGDKLEDLNELWGVFVKSVERKDARNTICILDGIDECHPGLRGRLLQLMSDYFAEHERSQSQNCLRGERKDGEVVVKNSTSKFKMLVTSRPENQIKIAFQARARGQTGGLEPIRVQRIIRLRGEDETDAISGDITKVVRAKVDDLICQGLPQELLEDIEAELLAKADRTFLWVSLILNLFEQKVESGASRRELDKLLRNRDIYNIYGELLASHSDSPRSRRILEIILAATRPLTVDEISIALAVTPEDDRTRLGTATFDNVEYDLVYPFENHIKSLCGHFIRIIRQKVYFVHETAREFLLKEGVWRSRPLLSSNTSDIPGPIGFEHESRREIGQCCFQHSFTLSESRYMLLRICATYLYCLGREHQSGRIGIPSAKTSSFLDYAAKSWVTHFQQTRKWKQLEDTYYQNLCHPLFPGFNEWIKQYWLPILPHHPPGSADEIQDFYIAHFKLYSHDETTLDPCLGVGSERKKDEYCIGRENANGEHKRYALSSNPGSLNNHYFPIRVNSGGFVSLDFSKTQIS
ncbi:hypothetical protein GGS26DRAFT_546781 [Hypomontagnella submonticulosa]|nr:hypothetical protein GGS26DRAFT_546781 [Hypomontagnella submonticulosa]